MKRVLLATAGIVAMAAVSGSAFAADLPARMPVKAPPAYVAPIFSWTGFYIGGHVGWARVDMTETITAAPAGFGTGTIGDQEDGFIGGGQVGFNWQINQFVLGVEGQLSGADIGRTANTNGVVLGLPVTATSSVNVDWMATLAARLGVAFGPALIYGKVGAAWLDWSANASATAIIGGVPTTVAATGGDTETGWMLGAGLEYAFTPNWSTKIEYNYLDFGTQSYAAGGFVVDSDLTTHLVKVGINYRFGPW